MTSNEGQQDRMLSNKFQKIRITSNKAQQDGMLANDNRTEYC